MGGGGCKDQNPKTSGLGLLGGFIGRGGPALFWDLLIQQPHTRKRVPLLLCYVVHPGGFAFVASIAKGYWLGNLGIYKGRIGFCMYQGGDWLCRLICDVSRLCEPTWRLLSWFI